MHEMSLMTNLIRKVEGLAKDQEGARIGRIKIRLGALSHFSKEHFTDHFLIASRGTIAENAALDLHVDDDIHAPTAADVYLEEVDFVAEG